MDTLGNFGTVVYCTPSYMMNKLFKLFENNSNNLIPNIEDLSEYLITESRAGFEASGDSISKRVFKDLDSAENYLFNSFKSIIVENCNGTKIAKHLEDHLNDRFDSLKFHCSYDLDKFHVILDSADRNYQLLPSESLEASKLPCSAKDLVSICKSIYDYTKIPVNVLYRGFILD